MESTQPEKELPGILVLGKNIGDALELTKSKQIPLSSFTTKTRHLHEIVYSKK